MTRATDLQDAHMDVIAALEAYEPFTYGMAVESTGGNCYALRIDLAGPSTPDGDPTRYLTVTDAEMEANLAMDPADRSGWMVGYYGPENEESPDNEATGLFTTTDASIHAVVALCLRAEAALRRPMTPAPEPDDGVVVCQWCLGDGCKFCGGTGRRDTGCADWTDGIHAVIDPHDGEPLVAIDECPVCGTGPWAARIVAELRTLCHMGEAS